MSDWEAILSILGMGVITLLTRSFFFLSTREWVLPHWVNRGLRYAPIAALAAIVAPEVITHKGVLIHTWMDPRLVAMGVATAYYFWRRGILGHGGLLAFTPGLGLVRRWLRQLVTVM
jgi:branched-subunit amino acid transport protein